LSAAAATPLSISRPVASAIVFRRIVSSLKKTNHRDANADAERDYFSVILSEAKDLLTIATGVLVRMPCDPSLRSG
jgi:hypothetical protein